MTATYYILTAPDDNEVLRWFREQPEKPDEYLKKEVIVLHFPHCGDLARATTAKLMLPARRLLAWSPLESDDRRFGP